MFVGNGDSIPGITGTIRRTRDAGASWDAPQLSATPNSVVYWFAASPHVDDVMVAASIYGYVYVSTDGGDTWDKLQKEFGEIPIAGADAQRIDRRQLLVNAAPPPDQGGGAFDATMPAPIYAMQQAGEV